MAIDPYSHLFLHRQEQRERDRRLKFALAIRKAPDTTQAVTSAESRSPISRGLLGSLRRPSPRGPTAASGSPAGVAGR